MSSFEARTQARHLEALDARVNANPPDLKRMVRQPDEDGNALPNDESLKQNSRRSGRKKPATRRRKRPSETGHAHTSTKPAGTPGTPGTVSIHAGSSVPIAFPSTGNTGNKKPAEPIVMGESTSPNGTPLAHFVLAEKPTEEFPKPGVYYVGTRVEKEGEVIKHRPPSWICSPLRVAATTRNDRQGEWGRLLIFQDLDGHEHRWVMPIELLSGNADQVRATLMREGALITPKRTLRQHLESFLQMQRPDVDALCVNRTGWHGRNVFVLPSQTFGDTEKQPVLFQSEEPSIETIGQAGDLGTWRDRVSKPCAGNTRLVFALSMAFAAPCLGLMHAESGGVHFRGRSSSGKSSALHVASSVYGRPADYSQEWRATDNGLEATATLHSDLLLVLDELGQIDPEPASKSAYMLANGKGKQRGTKSGGSRPVRTWRVLFASAGERSLGDLVAQGGGRIQAGQEVRVIDLPADADAGMGLFESVPEGMSPGEFSDYLKTATNEQYGTAFPEFLRALTAAPEKCRNTLRDWCAEIGGRIKPADATGQVNRVADRFTLIAAAGELATSLDITGWEGGESERAAAACFAAWLDARGTAGNAEPAAMLARARQFLSANGESRFTPWDTDAYSPRTVNRAGYRKDGSDGPTYYIEPEVFRSDVCKGFDARAVARVLMEAGALENEGNGRLTKRVRLPDGRNMRVYVVTPDIWND